MDADLSRLKRVKLRSIQRGNPRRRDVRFYASAFPIGSADGIDRTVIGDTENELGGNWKFLVVVGRAVGGTPDNESSLLQLGSIGDRFGNTLRLAPASTNK